MKTSDALILTDFDRDFLFALGIEIPENAFWEIDADAIEAETNAIGDATGFSGEPH